VRPVTLTVAVVLLGAEAVVGAGVAVLFVYLDLVRRTGNAGAAIGETVVFALLAAFLAVCARALFGRRRWARNPAVFSQLALLPVGYYMITGGLPYLGIPLLALNVAVIALLVAPATRAALEIN